jgi:hypothetical protein
VQAYLAKVGIQAGLDYPEMGKWASYMGPGTWPEGSVLYTLAPAIDAYYAGGLQWLFNQLGQSWQRPPELLDALAAALSSPAPDIKLIRGVTDMMSKDSLFIPINEGVNGSALVPYVMDTAINERGTTKEFDVESVWLNK